MRVDLPLPPKPTHFMIGKVYRHRVSHRVYLRTNDGSLVDLETGYIFICSTSDHNMDNYEDVTDQVVLTNSK